MSNRAPNGRNRDTQVRLFYSRVSPYSGEQFVLRHERTCVLDKKDQNVERTGWERNRCLVPEETTLRRLEAERTEPIDDHREPARVLGQCVLYEQPSKVKWLDRIERI